MREFKCPSNPDTSILEECPIVECPFHYERTSKFFKSEKNTACFCIDSNEVFDRTVSAKNKVTAIIRDSNKILPEKTIRENVNEVLEYAKIVYLLNEVPTKTTCKCGKKQKCNTLSPTCDSHLFFIETIINFYGLVPSYSRVVQCNILLEKGILKIPEKLLVTQKEKQNV